MRIFIALPKLIMMAAILAGVSCGAVAEDATTTIPEMNCRKLPAGHQEDGRRLVCADIAAFDHMLVYNRFGSFNPKGMVFALRRDIVSASKVPVSLDAASCSADIGTDKAIDTAITPGMVRFKDCKRPRPMVLRANEGDLLQVRVSNLLQPPRAPLVVNTRKFATPSPDFSKDFCEVADNNQQYWKEVNQAVSRGDDLREDHQEATCKKPPADDLNTVAEAEEKAGGFEWPRTRDLSFAVQGLTAIANPHLALDDTKAAFELQVCRGLQSIAPGQFVDCFYLIDRIGPYFLSSKAAPAGGEGDGGSITHGLFGAVVVQERDTSWFRSQVSNAAFSKAWEDARATDSSKPRHARNNTINYEQKHNGFPVLNMVQLSAGAASEKQGPVEIVHTDLNAVVHVRALPAVVASGTTTAIPARPESSFREFSVFFHDELKSFYTRNFKELGEYGQLAGVRDGFAINYGASGMGAILLANRKNIGPAKDCVECFYEEFFLSSWANGDPALLERFSDDPSNVHHSYLNDEVKFRNFHAGPKETHVFHLHAHQWFAGNDKNRGSYLDSQTVAPQQGFSYDIYSGGRDDNQHGGSGNRNRTVGDSIFHCHLYPHFAQGMWELWRVHDVLEDGTRKLPDGQAHAGLSLEEVKTADLTKRRRGSVDPVTGAWIENAEGTPIPALVPLPTHVAPVLPSYAEPTGPTDDDGLLAEGTAAMAGYPFYIAGKPGHRPPQAPMDIARATKSEGGIVQGGYLDGGLPRHVFADGGKREFPINLNAAIDPNIGSPKRERDQAQLVAKMLMRGDMTAELKSAKLELRSYDGTTLERAAMGFHYNGKQWNGVADISVKSAQGETLAFNASQNGYVNAAATSLPFRTNGAPPKPGAPFADPCGSGKVSARKINDPLLKNLNAVGGALDFGLDDELKGFRRYSASAVQLDLITNRAGWHDPQARINVLTADSDRYKSNSSGLPDGVAISPFVSAREEPFFFRAYSGECIEFRHTNETPKDLELDDFQVKTPTDVIGQHIHLVKFDVTASDGSGNGFNYEDGTLAADEIAARICAAKTAGQAGLKQVRSANEFAILEDPALCVAKIDSEGHSIFVPADKEIWRKKRSEFPHLFQTTVQRWFADPILSDDGETAGNKIDRTMRTVFSHDHFGPSSIQQHGFYTALVIEPSDMSICAGELGQFSGSVCAQGADKLVTDLTKDISDTSKALVGVHRIIVNNKPLQNAAAIKADHPDYREYALAIADFSTLYDPRDTRTVAEIIKGHDSETSKRGLEMLACEARWSSKPIEYEKFCNGGIKKDDFGNWYAAEGAPAWAAAGHTGDSPHEADYSNFITPDDGSNGDAEQILSHLIEYRQKAALTMGDRLASPVNPPQRPESISVDHHDPYLVNYRGEPVPLRVGTKISGAESSDCILKDLPQQGVVADPSAAADHVIVSQANPCSIGEQRKNDAGDMSNAFLSSLHGDPATRILETYSGDRTMVRLIQGAQEVQHMFNIEGYAWKRNIDQKFAQNAPLVGALEAKQTQRRACNELDGVKKGRPRDYDHYLRKGISAFRPGAPGNDPLIATQAAYDFFKDFQKASARCNNIEGYTPAQEIGISEHFEMQGVYRQNVSLGALRATGPDVVKNDYDRNATDYMYDFGTIDAIWNGAWGLLRVYRGENSTDYSTCLRSGKKLQECNAIPKKIKDSLLQIDFARIGAGLSGNRAADVRTTQIIECPDNAPRVSAAVAAIEASRANRSSLGMRYGHESYDPDGLILVGLDPAIVGPLLNTSDSRRKIENLIDRQDREPYVLRVKAGECVELTVINLLKNHSGANPSWPGLKDEFGDARMPAITGLNTDPEMHVDDSGAATLDVSAAFKRRGNIRPSARLALRFPLPTLNRTQEIALPFGVNATASLSPAGKSVTNDTNSPSPAPDVSGFTRRQASYETLNFYAGKAFLDLNESEEKAARENLLLPELTNQLRNTYPLSSTDPVKKWIAERVHGTTVSLDPVDDGSEPTLEFLGQPFALKSATGSGTLQNLLVFPPSFNRDTVQTETNAIALLWDRIAKGVLSRKTTWHPYAFGALPIKSFGDMIGHGAHGLLGAIDVVPCDWNFNPAERRVYDISNSGTKRMRPCGLENEASVPLLRHDVLPVEQIASGQGVSVLQPRVTAVPSQACDAANDNCHKIREFVLFVQDGLNLWDQNTKRTWRFDKSNVRVKASDGTPAKLTADCMICDDSYDLGDTGISYHSAPYFARLRNNQPTEIKLEKDSNLNNAKFNRDFFLLQAEEDAAGASGKMPGKIKTSMPVLRAVAGEELVIRVLEPNGRARQHAFVTIALDYDDLFPGFGFPHSALMSPGKSLTANITQPVKAGCYLFHDGPAHLASGGIWGLIDVVASETEYAEKTKSNCRAIAQP